ncbi:MAG: hypothetical protein QM687_00435 [Ferruginibacter sp.]
MKKIKIILSNAISILLLSISMYSYSQDKTDSAKNVLTPQSSVITIKFGNDSLEIESIAALRQINKSQRKSIIDISEDINKPVGLIVALIGLVISIPAFFSTFKKKEKEKYY